MAECFLAALGMCLKRSWHYLLSTPISMTKTIPFSWNNSKRQAHGNNCWSHSYYSSIISKILFQNSPIDNTSIGFQLKRLMSKRLLRKGIILLLYYCIIVHGKSETVGSAASIFRHGFGKQLRLLEVSQTNFRLHSLFSIIF